MPYQTTTIPTDVLHTFIADIFTAAGCERPEGEQIAYHLLSANLTGHDSHGVIRTPRYITWLQEGKVRAGQTLTVVHETLTQAIVDGNYGFAKRSVRSPSTLASIKQSKLAWPPLASVMPGTSGGLEIGPNGRRRPG